MSQSLPFQNTAEDRHRMTTGLTSKEVQILQRVRQLLDAIVSDTHTPPGMRHPLSASTAHGIHDCLMLIQAREQELVDPAGHTAPELETRILRLMKRALTDVAKDTSAPPGTAHPLAADTIQGLRECLGLIAARERELSEQAGRPQRERPEFIDEPKKTQVVTLHRKKPDDGKLH
jgi:hypothetical protein